MTADKDGVTAVAKALVNEAFPGRSEDFINDNYPAWEDAARAAIAAMPRPTPAQEQGIENAAKALLDRLYRSHLPSDAALPYASLEWQDARRKADALKALLPAPSEEAK